MKTLFTVSKTRPGADCGSDHELLIAKFRLKLKKVGKTTRPLRCNLNQIPNNYRVEVRKRFRLHLSGLVVFPTFFNLSLNLAIRSS